MLDDDYRIAPKIDGERRLMVVLDGHLYLIDRHVRVESFPTVQLPTRYNQTIVDGELVLLYRKHTSSASLKRPEHQFNNLSDQESWYFVIFDVLCFEGEYICHIPLHERLKRAKPMIEQLASLPFTLICQDYYRLDRIQDIFKQQQRRMLESSPDSVEIEEEDTSVGVLLANGNDDDVDEFDNENAYLFPTDGLLFVPIYSPYRYVLVSNIGEPYIHQYSV